MRGRLLLTLLTVLGGLALGGGTAAGVPTGWTVAPGGSFVGVGDPTAPPVACVETVLAGELFPDGDLLGRVDGYTAQYCLLYSIPIQVVASPSWSVSAVSHANGVTDVVIDDISVAAFTTGCSMTVTGSASASYDNATGVLTVHQQHTAVASVDPVDDCLGLVRAGDPVPVLSTAYAITPGQLVEPA